MTCSTDSVPTPEQRELQISEFGLRKTECLNPRLGGLRTRGFDPSFVSCVHSGARFAAVSPRFPYPVLSMQSRGKTVRNRLSDYSSARIGVTGVADRGQK
ncbi:hypothetical protein MASR2M8_08130 [Opitutaceae bacterium]